jgi:hypothetical protein
MSSPLTLTPDDVVGIPIGSKEDGQHVEGDMRFEETEDGSNRNAVIGNARKWPKEDGIVTIYYHFHSSLNQKAKDAVYQAAEDYAKWTCINWVETKKTSGMPHLAEFNPGQGCNSYVGFATRGATDATEAHQVINLGHGCEFCGTATHEMMHALGFYHEQSRPDRDQYVTIYWENLLPGADQQYKKCQQGTECTTQNLPYDYGSIMHYGNNFFAKDGLVGMVAKNGAKIGQRKGMDPLDIEKINTLYQCNGRTVKNRSANEIYPSERPTDEYSNCADMVKKCNQPGKNMKTKCGATCAKIPESEGYDMYSNCGQFKGSCAGNKQISTECSWTCNH